MSLQSLLPAVPGVLTALVLCAAVASGDVSAPPGAGQATKVERAAGGGPDAVFTPVEEDPALPRVLLIGDSISMGYTGAVRTELAGVANVARIPRNGGATTRGLEHIESWLGDKPWDVIHFNWGLHDLKRLDADGRLNVSKAPQVPPQAYEENLRKLVKRLKATGARLVWASTTPVPEGAAGRVPGDEVAYNAIAARIMNEQGVATDDLHAYILPELAKYQQPGNVHFTREGSQFLGEKVAREIRKALAAPGNRGGALP